jgi:imidazole glycerol-phosphate synthase subunit HisF
MNLIRIIPRLDIKGPNVVKGLCFDGYRVLGHPETFAEKYYETGADELFFQDTVASLYNRNNLLEIVSRTAKKVMIPITVCGGIRNIKDIKTVLRSGADKVAINTAAIANPQIIEDSAKMFGSQCIVASIEAKRKENGKYEAWVDYGRQPTGVDVFEWSKRVVELGAGEIYLSSVDRDGSGTGFDIELIKEVASLSTVPVIASSGAGKPDHFKDAIIEGCADAVSAASIFHYRYSQAVENEFMSYNKQKLRMGEQIDSGNIEFLKSGYGGLSDLQVDPQSINDIKNFLLQKGVRVR